MTRRLIIGACALTLLAPPAVTQAAVETSAATMGSAAAQAVAAVPADRKNKKKKRVQQKRKKRVAPRVARVWLGFHNHEGLPPGQANAAAQQSWRYLARRGAPHRARVNCVALMTSTTEELVQMRSTLEGLPGLFSGCGSGPGMWKYGASGPMGGYVPTWDWARYYPPLAARQTSSATPTVAAYTSYLRRLKAVFGNRIESWEVWNEVDLSTFYRGTPQDLVDLTFAAAKVFGRNRVTSPSFSPTTVSGPNGLTGAKVGSRYLTRIQFYRQYWMRLVATAKKRKVPLPLKVINIHTYGSGNTVSEAAKNRMWKTQRFLAYVKPILGRAMNSLEVWDTEWNLRRSYVTPEPPYHGYADSPANARLWAASARAVACAGVDRQYTYVWTNVPAQDWEFQHAQLQMHPGTTQINAAYRSLNNTRVRCG